MSDYRERAERLEAELKQRQAESDAERDATNRDRLAEIEEYLAERRRLVEEALDYMGVEGMLEDANRSVWEGRGRIEVEVGGELTARYSLSKHKEIIVPVTQEVKRPGVVWVQDEPPSVQPDWEGGGRYHRSIGMKTVGYKTVGSKDVGGNTVLSVKISIPLKTDRPGPSWPEILGKIVVSDTDLAWSEDIKDHLPDLATQPGYQLSYQHSENGLTATRGAQLIFDPIDFDPELLKRFVDTSIVLNSAARLRGIE